MMEYSVLYLQLRWFSTRRVYFNSPSEAGKVLSGLCDAMIELMTSSSYEYYNLGAKTFVVEEVYLEKQARVCRAYTSHTSVLTWTSTDPQPGR